MIEAFIAVVALALVQEWRHSRSQDRFQVERDSWVAAQEAHRAQVDSILAGHRQEIAALCQRIQAPEYAVVEHAQQAAPPNEPAVHPMLDDDYWQAEEERQRAIAEIERLEREGFDLAALRT